MPNPKLATPAQRHETRWRRAQRKQARRRVKRREKIIAGLIDPLTAGYLEREQTDSGDDAQPPPLLLLPARRLRARVTDLNVEVASLLAQAAPPETRCRPDAALLALPAVDPTGREEDDSAKPDTGEDENNGDDELDAGNETEKTGSQAGYPRFELPVPTRTPRKRGRARDHAAPPSRALHPFMPDQTQSLAAIFDLLGHHHQPELPGLGRRHRCPLCQRGSFFAQNTPPPPDPLVLTVYPTAAGDLVFRCRTCGYCLDSVEFVAKARTNGNLAEAASWLSGAGILAGPLAPEQLAGYERLGVLRALFERGRPHVPGLLHTASRSDRGEPLLFGDWAVLAMADVVELFSGHRFPERWSWPSGRCLGRLGRDLFDRPTLLDLHGARWLAPLYRLPLRDWPQETETLSGGGPVVFAPRWADHLEWRRLIVVTENLLARELERAVARWPDDERLPVALLDQAEITTATMATTSMPSTPTLFLEPISPVEEVWLALRGDRSVPAHAGLPFWLPSSADNGATPQTTVRVRRLPVLYHKNHRADGNDGSNPAGLGDMTKREAIGLLESHPSVASRAAFCNPQRSRECVADVAKGLAAERSHQSLGIALADVLAKEPGIHPATRRRLFAEVATAAGVTLESLAIDTMIAPNGTERPAPPIWPGGPFVLHAPGGTGYLAKGGSYWRCGSRESEWTAVSNFSLRLQADESDPKGHLVHHAKLTVGDRAVDVALSAALFDDYKRLWRTLTQTARAAGMDYPILSDPKAKRLLPELIKATQPAPPALQA